MSSSNPEAFSPQNTRIGFVGIGNMGDPMASALVKAGWRVRIYDIDPARSRKFVESHGGSAAASLEELGRVSDVVITMLPDGKIVRTVIFGSGGGDCLIKGLAKGAVVMDMSSSSPVGTRELGKDLAEHGLLLLDAPVSGGVKGAGAATLAIMVGGDQALAARCDPVLAPMGKRFYIGSLGSGHAMKVLNNFVSAAGLAAAGEALLIGGRFGIDPKVMIDVLNASSGRNNSTENKFAQFILSKKFNSGFSMGLMTKDLALAMEVAQACDLPSELGHATLDLWKAAEKTVGAKADHTEMVRHLGEI